MNFMMTRPFGSSVIVDIAELIISQIGQSGHSFLILYTDV